MDFEQIFLPHLDAAYNLARWLVRNEDDARDVVQEAFLRAIRFRSTWRGGDPRAWLMTIVRNTAFTYLSKRRVDSSSDEFDETVHSDTAEERGPETDALRSADAVAIRTALEELPVEFREVVVMRDIEGMSYKEIADAADVPIGTVMSRLARARERLRRALGART